MHDYKVITCCLDKACKSCGYVPNALVLRSVTGEHTLYCDNCGAYIKQASKTDTRLFHRTKMRTTEKTPLKVIMRCIASELTWGDIYP